MTLGQKIKLIDDLIAEDRGAEIRDYLDILEEVENIETENKPDMPYKWISPEDRETVIRLAQTKSPKEIKAETKLSFSIIYRALKSGGVDLRKLAMLRRREQKRKDEVARIAAIQARRPAVEIKPDAPGASKIQRVPAEYSNQGFLSTIQKYAV